MLLFVKIKIASILFISDIDELWNWMGKTIDWNCLSLNFVYRVIIFYWVWWIWLSLSNCSTTVSCYWKRLFLIIIPINVSVKLKPTNSVFYVLILLMYLSFICFNKSKFIHLYPEILFFDRTSCKMFILSYNWLFGKSVHLNTLQEVYWSSLSGGLCSGSWGMWTVSSFIYTSA